MKGLTKSPQKCEGLPPTKTLKTGTYKLFEGAQEAVVVRNRHRVSSQEDTLTDSDLLLQLVDGGWEKAEKAYYEGLDEGYSMGFTVGLREGYAKAERTTDFFKQALDSVEKGLLRFYAGVERWSVKLSMTIAEKVIEKAAHEHEDIVKQTVRKAIAETADKTKIIIKVNPTDLEILKDLRSDISELSEGIDHLKFEVDAGVTPGSCRVETPSGLVDADFTTQLSELRKALILHEEARE
ncbi:hypothetical protein CEE37_00690 [candidate division LCP-89 bacterium B3_LCP]|uniref:Flagellar assembly protein FliH n=1 Tax=candidate division LCP-89 bacterium B3_LCP TaxID=2012998 RepID=A0A532V4U1_UNCL8|nr:MAG: hypothetical protein CEE37_00690 [candidate division LCP-89 bacterium B3_LCP]